MRALTKGIEKEKVVKTSKTKKIFDLFKGKTGEDVEKKRLKPPNHMLGVRG